MEALLDFSQPVNVQLLDSVVQKLYTGNPDEQRAVQTVLTQFQEHPDAWQRVDSILEYTSSEGTKFFGLQILDNCIKYRWKALPVEQRDGIKGYIVKQIIAMSSDEATLRGQRVYLHKLNLILVQVLKQEWPQNWQGFIPEIVQSSKVNEVICENNMEILKLLSEEVFDFSNGQMTQAKIKELKNSFNNEFSLIYQLCEYILANSQKPSLIAVTLQTLLRFLNWIPLGYIFETQMLDQLVRTFFPVPAFRNHALRCLTEIGSLDTGEAYHPQFVHLFVRVMQALSTFLPPHTNMAQAYENGSEDDQEFVSGLALFFTGFCKGHLSLVEKDNAPLLIEALHILVRISEVQDDGDEIFKICLEYWSALAEEVYHSDMQSFPVHQPLLMLGGPLGGQPMLQSVSSGRRQLFGPVFSKLRAVMISRMAKPEEVLIVEDDNGEIIRELIKDGDAIILYKSMRECLIYLTHLDYEDTEVIMLEKLKLQVDGSEWSWHNLNTLCWAIGSISGAMTEDDEKRFIVTVIKELLGMCEMKRGKDNKAVIASNIMYVVGQYPRFLKAHWKFLKTVVNKLFEFMHEPHPGVQDMAVETFVKISQKCKKKFVMVQAGETQPLVEELLTNLRANICDLEPHQIHTFYEAVGYMISAVPMSDVQVQQKLVAGLFSLPNETWHEIIEKARINADELKVPETTKNIAKILTTNVRVAASLGHPYISQLQTIYVAMLHIYKLYSELISTAVQQNGPGVTKTAIIRNMRSVKKETLRLIETVIEKSEDKNLMFSQYVPELMDPILGDYARNIPDTRDPEVLSLFAGIVNKLQNIITPEVPRIFGAVFECTLEMITRNFEDYPEHRINFFKLLRAINKHCFESLFMIPPEHFKLVMNSIVWAFRHAERNISETGLLILEELLKNVAAVHQVRDGFYKEFFLQLIQDLFVILTDTFHKPGFKLQAQILMHIFHLVESGQLASPLVDGQQQPNPVFLREHVANLLRSSFTNLNPATIQAFVLGLFDLTKELSGFKQHLRDFLVQLKEFSSQDNADLFLEEKALAEAQQKDAEQKRLQAVPGLIAQYQPSARPDADDAMSGMAS